MSEPAVMTPAMWQTGTAVVQAVCSIVLLGWYVLAAHLDRVRTRRETIEGFHALVRLCRDLGREAKEKTLLHLQDLTASIENGVGEPQSQAERFARWRADMRIVYICLNEVPHYEVRNPVFSTALTRLWLEVDARGVDPGEIEDAEWLKTLLTTKYERIGVEVDAMADLLATGVDLVGANHRLDGGVKRRGYRYGPDGFVEQQSS